MSDTAQILPLKDILDAKEVWASLVTTSYLKKFHTDVFETLCERARKSSDTFKLCVGDSEDAHAFFYHAGIPARPENVIVHHEVSNWPWLLILEPSSPSPSVLSLTNKGYQINDHIDQNLLMNILKNPEGKLEAARRRNYDPT